MGLMLSWQLLLGLGAGLAFGLSFIPWEVVNGVGAFWDSAESDRAASVTGYMYFADDSWHWPLGTIATLNLPFGTNVIYSDSIPLLALPMKLLHRLGLPAWNYFGAWLLACYALNGLAMALVLRVAAIRSVPVTILAALLAAAMPMLLHRWYHFALCGQFALLLGMACYIAVGHTRQPARAVAVSGLVVVLSATIHAYLGAMALALYGATLLRGMRCHVPDSTAKSRRLVTRPRFSSRLGFASANLAGLGVVLGVVAVALGYFSVDGPPVRAGGYGYFSANLLSPFVSELSAFSPRAWARLQEAEIAATSWPFWRGAWPDATGGQYFEGFGYMGAGVLLLCILNFPYALRNTRRIVTSHWALLAVLIGAIFFAVSHRIYLDRVLLADFSPPEKIMDVVSTFRSSGRFLWLAAYAALVACVIFTIRRFGSGWGGTILLLAVALQLFDTTPLRRAINHDSRMTHTAGIDFAVWRPWLTSGIDRLEVVPSLQCGDPNLRNPKAALQYYAARVGPIPTNSASLARGRTDCAGELKALADPISAARTGWVFFADGVDLQPVRQFIAGHAQDCTRIGVVVACTRRD